MPNKPSLSKATCERLDVSWNTVNNASFYQIQLQLLDQPKDQNKQNGFIFVLKLKFLPKIKLN